MRASRLFAFLLVAFFGAVASAAALFAGFEPARYAAIFFVVSGAAGVGLGLLLKAGGELEDDVSKKSKD